MWLTQIWEKSWKRVGVTWQAINPEVNLKGGIKFQKNKLGSNPCNVDNLFWKQRYGYTFQPVRFRLKTIGVGRCFPECSTSKTELDIYKAWDYGAPLLT